MSEPVRLTRRIAGQIAILVVAAIVVTHVVLMVAFLLMRPELRRLEEHPGALANRLALVVRMLAAASPGERPAIAQAAGRGPTGLRLAVLPDEAAPARTHDSTEAEELQRALGEAWRVESVGRIAPGDDRPRQLVIRGRGLVAAADLPPRYERRTPLTGAIIATLVFLALSLTLLSVWAARALAAPLQRLAGAAEAFGTDMDLAPLPQAGPEEVLAVSRALDRMRARVKRLVDDRTHMLAAISHDLRTPITRLRLRAEFLEDETLRAQFLRDLDQMNALVEAALSFVRDGRSREGLALVDLASVVQTVCDGFADVGQEVRAEGLRPSLVKGAPDELQRALTNLVDNAVKYGGGATVRLVPAGPQAVAVEVLDEGPGIPEEEQAAMLEPFVRGDRARTLNEAGGFGLGLAIAHAIAQSHGGRLTLANRSPRGLAARLELPRAAAGVPRQAPAQAA
ncbi:integral membrane sensor signal transduction histidine kinase [Methylobacterium sp. 4-46]|uniref:ATP-binding protein n=1 Tax=unclassified Methylobacterium TaxID=2615210 RepID=UPI000152C98E|nr:MULTISPECIES: ATP-binding protein [Methylobacterium]ACA15403.1 integral membrane sensor signal transduction histidine kinase [Methylobacterium sp. 4-46]WFT81122.1 ATP-binding protein [Methylobacterium nodulans]